MERVTIPEEVRQELEFVVADEDEIEDHMPEPYVDEEKDMTPKVAYFVLGPESSGTKLVTKLLMKAGCFGSDAHSQFIDTALDDAEKFDRFLDGENTIVIRRSWPHGVDHSEPDIKELYDVFDARGYKVIFVVTMRSWPTMIESQVDAGQHAPDRVTAFNNISDATLKIFYWIKRLKVPYILVSYGDLLRNRTVTLHWMINALSAMGASNLRYDSTSDDIIDSGREDVRVRDYRSGAMA